ncbi:MAG TPA: hydrogenase maturation protease [Terriglobia bacterium]|nr:hydrogenase maturation protease [Terriglobia bacterium]
MSATFEPPFAAAQRPLVIGVGNRDAGDDGVGLVVAARLGERAAGAFRVLEHSGEGADLMSRWGEAESVVLIDAVRSGAEPGTLRRFDATAGPLPALGFRHSTHAFGVAEAVEVARTLNQLPRRLIVFAIEGANFAAGAALSGALERRLPYLAEQIFGELQTLSSESR